MTANLRTRCLVAGGGPAGMMAGYLMARAGIDTIVLERHGDFLRDFRGDTVHPSTLEIFNDLNLLDAFLQQPHERMGRIALRFRGTTYPVADLGTLPVAAPFIAFMPQWHFLNFIAEQGRALPGFTLLMETEATALRFDGDRVSGVTAKGANGAFEIEADLTIAADGRSSVLRAQSGLPRRLIGAPIDVLWFALPRQPAAADHSLLNVGAASVVITIDRGDYWQCAYVIEKDGFDAVRARGLDAFRATIADAAPHVGDAAAALASWDEVKLLSVAMDRLDRWSRPGLLCIGDAAHAMSPIGGVGINLAVQDAVAAANLLALHLAQGPVDAATLDRVRRRRAFAASAVQFVQAQLQKRVIMPIIVGAYRSGKPPLPLRLLAHVPLLRRLSARMIGLGPRPERVSAAIRQTA